MSGTEYYLAGLAILVASFVQGLSGFGFALLAVPMLTIVIGIKSAVTLVVVCSICITFYNYWTLRRYFSIRNLRELAIGSLFGIPLGAFFLRETHAHTIETLLGGIILGFVFLSSFNLVKFKTLNNNWGYCFGLAAGVCGGAVSISGPPVLIYSYIKGWNKEKFKGTIAAYFFISGLVILASHIATGLTTYSTFIQFLRLSPFLLFGAFTGHYFFRNIDTLYFRRIVLSILTALGMSMLFLNL